MIIRIIIAVIAIIFLIGLILYSYRKKDNEKHMNWLTLVVTALTPILAFLTALFPEQVATVIYPDVNVYISENETLISENDELKVSVADWKERYNVLDANYASLEEEHEILEQEYEDLCNRTFAELSDASLIVDGLKVSELSKCIALVNGKVFFDANVLYTFTGEKPEYDDKQNAIFWGDRNEITKVSFSEISDVLYNGQVYWKYISTGSSSFTVAGKSHNVGFVIGCDHSLFGEGDGYALFSLQGKYTEMEFDVGKTDDYEIQDVTLQVFLNGELSEQYELSGQATSKHIVVPLNNANDVKLLLVGGSRVKYGFFNVIFAT
jgi:hypothetical protein